MSWSQGFMIYFGTERLNNINHSLIEGDFVANHLMQRTTIVGSLCKFKLGPSTLDPVLVFLIGLSDGFLVNLNFPKILLSTLT